MTVKPKKTAQELQAMIMEQIRKQPELRSIMDVGVTPAVQSAAHHPSWQFGWWLRDGPAAASLKADEIARKFQYEFDLA
jgi:hypothetical protein